MKSLLIALTLVFSATAQAVDSRAADVARADAAKAQSETKQVCVDATKDGKPVTDPKTGKTKQNCKTMKVHKKHEGTAVPTK
jgi:hypothetical protein